MSHLFEMLESRRMMSVIAPLAQDFGQKGEAFTHVGSDVGFDKDVVALANGDFLVAGGSSEGSITGYLARYLPNGALDQSFGKGGISFDSSPGISSFNSVTVEPNGSILVVGDNGVGDFLRHYSASGVLDKSFGQKGTVSLSQLSAVSVASAGKNIFIAESYDPNPPGTLFPPWGPALALRILKLNSSGKGVAGFASGGVLNSNQYLVVSSIGVDSSGRIIVCGVTSPAEFGQAEVLRYRPGGALDTTFASKGILQTNGTSVTPDASGGYIVVHPGSGGSQTGQGGPIFLTRYGGNGQFDGGFGIQGQAILEQPMNSDSTLCYVSATSRGVFVATQNFDLSQPPNPPPFVDLYHLSVTGRADATFGQNGYERAASTDYVEGLAAEDNTFLTWDLVSPYAEPTNCGVEAYEG